MDLLTSSSLLTNEIFIAFVSTLRLEIPHTAFQINSAPLARALELSICINCLFS